MDVNLDRINYVYIVLNVLGIVISTVLCVWDEKYGGTLNVATYNEEDSQQYLSEDENESLPSIERVPTFEEHAVESMPGLAKLSPMLNRQYLPPIKDVLSYTSSESEEN